ncbi:transcriptional repressor [Uliginosibacterium sediminicola]|uniref:Transcriptional repressor n=1 Tax=Uliginosibacterium sediminicola TaxID=2024550 RepID=A0ABU9Z2L4_9RHOO
MPHTDPTQSPELRLENAGLRPTTVRLDILRLINAEGAAGACAERVFQLLLRGERCYSMGTVYRTIHQLEASGLLRRAHDPHGKVFYRSAPAEDNPHSWRLLCANRGICIHFEDMALHEKIRAILRDNGLADFSGQLRLESLAQPSCKPT